MKITSCLLRLFTAGLVTPGGLSVLVAETLTGIVKQPEAPYSPAPGSTVIVYERSTNKQMAGPDTTDAQGRYQYDIARGKEVVVKASWKVELSSPASVEAKVVKNPTRADIQLLPAKAAPPEQWLAIGQQGSTLTAGNSADVLRSLRDIGVPSESIYSYVFGVRKKNHVTFSDLDKLKLFNTNSPWYVVEAIKAAEEQYKTTSTVPNYEQLKLKDKELTEAEHIELLGFITPSNRHGDLGAWNWALERSLGVEGKEQVLKENVAITKALYNPKEAENRERFKQFQQAPDKF
jgi:hypothetical protein